MKGQAVDQLVFDYMFPKPKANDPQNFPALLQRSLIPEVRQETHAYYGHLETQEAKYPGLDYANTTHRIRLGRWPWHRRLFRAFDGLRLTNSEIAGLTKWEGTKWAKEKYEKEQGVTIRDTTSDGFPNWEEPAEEEKQTVYRRQAARAGVSLSVLDNDEDMYEEETDDEFDSVGIELNEQLRTQAARREAGDTSAVLDEEWEQWLKNAIETGELALLTEQMTEQMFRRATGASVIPAALVPPGMLSAARAGQWTEIPEFLHSMLRRTLQAEQRSPESISAAAASGTGSARAPTSSSSLRRSFMDSTDRLREPWTRRTYSDLRLPVGESSTQRTAEASNA